MGSAIAASSILGVPGPRRWGNFLRTRKNQRAPGIRQNCHARWWFKYNLKQPDPPNGNMALGRAVHWAITQNFLQKVETYEDLSLPGVLAIFREAWAREGDLAEFPDYEEPSQLGLAGEALV